MGQNLGDGRSGLVWAWRAIGFANGFCCAGLVKNPCGCVEFILVAMVVMSRRYERSERYRELSLSGIIPMLFDTILMLGVKH